MTGNRFNPAAIVAKIDWFYEHGKPDKAREILLQPWPGMDDDLTCLYQHLIAASKVQSSQPLFLKSCSFDDDGITCQFPDWTIAAAHDLEGRYGQQEGRLRWQKANAVFAQMMIEPDGLRRLEEACSAAAEKMVLQ
jgi:hypothetical protein